MTTRSILCLANSRKHGGRCVAGLSADGAGWVRAVSPTGDGTLSIAHYTFADGAEAAPLDLVEIPIQESRPRKHHPEDWVIAGERWRRLPRLADQDIVRLLRPHVEAGPALIRGTGDRIAFASIEEKPMEKSLALAMPESIELYRKQTLRGSWLARGRFRLAGASYDLGLTDPVWVNSVTHTEQPTNVKPAGKRILLTISLSEMFEGCFFKLIATLLLIPKELDDQLMV
ncbi:MAG: hypothetical protein HY040_27270 [Planctomycetes bacterium]|nr:hypothetical protein [Planctomycetota bacterium]